ncbi:PREDICTED: factor VIII intron 22 protein-like [Dipodomys ordii]|uniref:Factor VIII intron 22 protein-like n=1 Tax=Dipodomys ordii TaxID=10020 RepID=A0A1S3GR65_DIPOR|nr:PREDICTED: factor VIII intron 22 protein-like [Dipodomys ordii]
MAASSSGLGLGLGLGLGGGGGGGGGGVSPGSEAGDFLARYRLVSNKLKKRFLRKPNVAEAGEQFGQLGRELRAQECLPYAAWCQLAVARCQQALFHGPGEALALTEAARLFLRQEPGPGAAPAPLPANSGSAAPSPATLGAFSDVLARCEVSRVLLLLLLQPPPAKLLPEHAQTLERYSWEAFDSHCQDGSSGQLPEELFLLLQSLVMATHEKDTEAVKSLQVEMWPLLSAEQNHLLHLVLQETISPSGQGV